MEEHWYKEAVIYELHVKCFYDSSGDGIGDFKGLTQKLDYLQDLGITAIWLLPFFSSPLKDDGYDISDYTNIHSNYGDLRDFKTFLAEAHKRGINVIIELVVNHTSDQHPWFQKARHSPKGSREYNFYVWSDTPDRYKDARIIFQDFESSNWSWDPVAKSYYWHRFYSNQPDLNFENPEVHRALFRILSFWLKMGVDGVRLDAVPYLYEKEGTNCENLSETHQFLKKLREYVDAHFKERMLLAEANQWPEDAAKYFGEGDECHMAFHFPVMPRLFMAIHLEDSLPIIEIMEQTPKIPEVSQWALFLRNHDELTLEMVTDEERDYMFRVYAYDPQARLNLGIRRRLAPLLKNDRRKIELMNALLFSLTGTPVLYYGDELGMGDNIYLGDRNGVRTPMQWSNDRNAGFSRANPQQLYLPPIIDPEYHYETVNVEAQQNNPFSLYWWTRQMISLRKRFKAFGYGTTEFLVPENRKVLVFFREYQQELIMIIANLSRFPQYVELDLKKYNGFHLIELFSGQRFPKIGELPYFLTLGPYGYYWFALKKEPESWLTLLEREREKQVAEILITHDEERIFNSRMRRLLESVLKRYLLKRGWYASKIQHIDRTKTRIVDHSILSVKEKIHLFFIETVFTNGVIKRYPIYLKIFKGEKASEILAHSPENVVCKFNNPSDPENVSLILDVSENGIVSNAIVDIIQYRRRVRCEVGEIKGKLLAKPLLVQDSEIKSISREEDAIFFPYEKGVLKVFTLIEEGMNLDVEMRLFLTNKTQFRNFLPIMGYMEYEAAERVSVALAEEVGSYQKRFNFKELTIESADRFLVRMESAKKDISDEMLVPEATLLELAQRELSTTLHTLLGEYIEVARLLGTTTAEFHLALNSQPLDPVFAPISFNLFFQRSLYQNIRKKIVESYGFLKLNKKIPEHLREDADKLLTYEKQILSLIQILPHYKISAERSRYHGDYKLEHLFYTGKECYITNLDGNLALPYSERKYKRSPLIDVMTILLSIEDSSLLSIQRLLARGQEADYPLLKKWALSWNYWVGSSFLRAYLKKANEGSFLPTNPKEIDFLLLLFLLEKSFTKIIQEAKDGTYNIEAPLAMLLHWLPNYEKFKLL